MIKARVSVIMTHFGAGRYLREAVASVLDQTLRDLTLLLLDDASPDRSWFWGLGDLARDPRLVVLQSDRNVGTYRLKNAALERVSTRWVAFHDSDDRSLPTRMMRQLAVLERGAADIVGTSFVDIDAAGRRTGTKHLRRYADWWARRGARFVLHHPTSMMALEVLRELGGFDGTTRIAADTDFALRASHRYRIRNLWRPLYEYRRHCASLTGAPATGYGSASRERYMRAVIERHRARRQETDRTRLQTLTVALPNDVDFALRPVDGASAPR